MVSWGMVTWVLVGGVGRTEQGRERGGGAKEHAGLRKDSGLDWNGNRKTLSWIQMG